MPDTLTAPAAAPVAPSTPSPTEGVVVSAPESSSTPTAPQSIAEASKAFRESLTAEQLAQPMEIEDTSTDLDPNAGFDAPTQGADGRWRYKDGTFAPDPSAAKVEAAPAATDPTVVDPAAGEQPAPETDSGPAPIPVVLKDRNGQDVEIDVTDPQVAELLRANANDGLRRNEYNRRMQGVEQREADQRAFEVALKTNPDEVILQRLSEEAQARIAVTLIAKHWDRIVPQLVQFDQDPSQRIVAATQAQLNIARQREAFQQTLATERQVAQIHQGVQSLVPDTVDETTAARFLADADVDLARAVEAGYQVTPETLRTLLAPRMALYGFDKLAASQSGSVSSGAVPGAPSAAVVSPAPVPARPVARLRQPATGAVAGITGSVADPAALAQRTQQVMQARSIGAAVPPAGAGAPAIKAPAIPKGASVEDASKLLRQTAGRAGWAAVVPG